MEEPHFIKCEPEWSAETGEILNLDTNDYFPGSRHPRVKTETEPSCDPELNTEEENRDLFTEFETQILKEEIIEEVDISGRNLLDDGLDLPATSSNGKKGAQDMTLNDDLTYPCCHCEKVFKRALHLKKHMRNTHKRKDSL
ncbi:uncharacterized protein [Anabrus simplex]|uniref:uncharacterized protein n=1 Tax=Anabrus simplex TaxID=316456 RepID=UPI0035A2DD46